MTQLYDEALRPSGLRATQLSLLTAVRRSQPVAVKRLAAGMGMDRTTLTRNLRLLERDGLVRVVPDPTDRRSKTIELTAAGDKRLVKAYPLWKEAQQRLSAVLGPKRTRALVSELTAVADTLWSQP
jgi:DNA-binding MarR family transcriptional regulator